MKNAKYRVFVAMLVVGFSALLTASLEAQSPQPTAPDSGAANIPKKRKVYYSAKRYDSKETPQGRIHTLSGTVVFTSEDSKLTTDRATFNEKTQIAFSPGKLKIEDTYNSIVGDTGTAFYKTRDAKFRGNVMIVANPRPEDKTAPEGSAQRQFDSPATIQCDNGDYNWQTRIAVATGHLTMKQKDRTATANRALYDGRQEKVTLEGDVRYDKLDGEKGEATKVVIIFKKGSEEFIANGPVKGVFSVEDDTDTASAQPKPAMPPGETKPAPPTPPAEPKPPTPGTPKP